MSEWINPPTHPPFLINTMYPAVCSEYKDAKCIPIIEEHPTSGRRWTWQEFILLQCDKCALLEKHTWYLVSSDTWVTPTPRKLGQVLRGRTGRGAGWVKCSPGWGTALTRHRSRKEHSREQPCLMGQKPRVQVGNWKVRRGPKCDRGRRPSGFLSKSYTIDLYFGKIS